jgi:general stress protein 26
MRDVSKAISNLIDKAGVSIISSVDEDGFPNSKAMLPPRKRKHKLPICDPSTHYACSGQVAD